MLPGPSFSINSLILPGFPLTSFHLAEASLSAFSWLSTLVCVKKYHKMSFIYNYSHFWYSFCNQPALFAQFENVNNLWKNNHAVHGANEIKTKTKPSHATFKLTTGSVVRFSP